MIQRYDDGMCGLEPDDDGAYVLYEDYYELEIKYTAMLTEIYKLVNSQLYELGGKS